MGRDRLKCSEIATISPAIMSSGIRQTESAQSVCRAAKDSLVSTSLSGSKGAQVHRRQLLMPKSEPAIKAKSI